MAKIASLVSREPHHLGGEKTIREASPLPENLSPMGVTGIDWRKGNANGCMSLSKQIPEPMFAIVKSMMGFRQFSLRLHKGKGERDSDNAGLEREVGADVAPA